MKLKRRAVMRKTAFCMGTRKLAEWGDKSFEWAGFWLGKPPKDSLRRLLQWCGRALRTPYVVSHFGASGPSLELCEIGRQAGRSKAAIGISLSHAIDTLRRQGSLKLKLLLDLVDSRCSKATNPLSAASISGWFDPARPPQYCAEFYLRLIARLRPDIPRAGE
jgi:hypothetical protein